LQWLEEKREKKKQRLEKKAPAVIPVQGQAKRTQSVKKQAAVGASQGQRQVKGRQQGGDREAGKKASIGSGSRQRQSSVQESPIEFEEKEDGLECHARIENPLPTPCNHSGPLPSHPNGTEEEDDDDEVQFVVAHYPGGAFEYGTGFAPTSFEPHLDYSQAPLSLELAPDTDSMVIDAPTVVKRKNGAGVEGRGKGVSHGKGRGPARRSALG